MQHLLDFWPQNDLNVSRQHAGRRAAGISVEVTVRGTNPAVVDTGLCVEVFAIDESVLET